MASPATGRSALANNKGPTEICIVSSGTSQHLSRPSAQAEQKKADFTAHVQSSNHASAPPCSYHSAVLGLHVAQPPSQQQQRNMGSCVHPIDRFLAAPSSQHHVVFSKTLAIGTAASDGCTCRAAVPKHVLSALTRSAIALSVRAEDTLGWECS